MKRRTILSTCVVAVLAMTVGIGVGNAFKLGDLLKVGGIIYIVDKFSTNINDFVNKLLINKGLEVKETTKVVPILSVGQGTYVGACQVSGSKKDVDKCNCVVQYEDDTVFGSKIRVRALVPCATRSTKNVKRLNGVGVSAMVDVKI